MDHSVQSSSPSALEFPLSIEDGQSSAPSCFISPADPLLTGSKVSALAGSQMLQLLHLKLCPHLFDMVRGSCIEVAGALMAENPGGINGLCFEVEAVMEWLEGWINRREALPSMRILGGGATRIRAEAARRGRR